MEQRTEALINAERAKVGCAAVSHENRLAAAARLHSADMAANDYFSHTDRSGGSPSDRVRAQGYPGGAAEIIAAGYRTPEEAVTGWMNSPWHKAIITDCRYTQAGAGFARGGSYGFYWTANFGSA